MLILLIAPFLARKAKLPDIIGLLAAGAIVGPNAIGMLERDATFQLLGTVGLLYIMFTAGLEIDLNRFFKYKNHSLIFGFFTFVIPQTIGTVIAYYWLGVEFMIAILLASTLASHTLLAYPAISRLGLSKASSVTTAVGGTIITDIAALLVLAVVLGSTKGELNTEFWVTLGGGFGLYCVLLFLILPRIGRWFFRNAGSEGVSEYVFVLAAVFLAAFLSEISGVEAIIGAFLAGLALNRLIPESGTLMNRIDFIGNALFIPFFLISVGMLIDVRVLFDDVMTLKVAAMMVGTVLVGKWLAAFVTQKILGYSHDEGMVVFSLSLAQAAATLAAGLVAYDAGLFDESMLNAAIITIAVTCVIAPMLGEKYGRKVMIQEEESRGGGDSDVPQRILIPMANAATARALVDFTFILREHGSEEPVYPLAVVPDDEETTVRVANAEKMLSNAVVQGASAEVPVVPITRVAHNPATGIARAILERRISDVVVGWQGPDTQQRGTFGRIIDQLLEESDQQIFVCRLTQPINTTKRVIVVFPPYIELHPGFVASVRAVKRLTNSLGALVTGLCLQDDMRRVRTRFDAVAPEVTSSFVGFQTFEDLLKTLKKRVEPNDLLVFLTARSGTVAWSQELERLPGRLGEFGEVNAVFLFAQQVEHALEEAAIARPVTVTELLRPERIALNMEPMAYEDAVSYLLATHFESDKRRLDKVTAEIVGKDTGFSTEAARGVILAHARSPEIFKTQVFVGTSSVGLKPEEDSDGSRIHLVIVLLNPEDTPLQDHLRHFAELGRLVASIEDAQKLAQSHTKGELIEALQDIAQHQGEHDDGEDDGSAEEESRPAIKMSDADETAV